MLWPWWAQWALDPEVGAMRLFRTKRWPVLDIGLLKACCILLGMIAGAYASEFTRHHVWFVALAALLLGIRPTVWYFRSDNE